MFAQGLAVKFNGLVCVVFCLKGCFMYKFKEVVFPRDEVNIYGYVYGGGRVRLGWEVQYRAWVNRFHINVPPPTHLEEEIRTDAWLLEVNTDGSTEETPLHDWAKNPFSLDDITGVHWLDVLVEKPPEGTRVLYQFFDKNGERLGNVGVDSGNLMHIKQPEGTYHLIMSWAKDGDKQNVYYFKKEEQSVATGYKT